MAGLLLEEKTKLNASQEDAYNFTIKIATGELKFEEIVSLLKSHTEAI